MSLQYQHIQVAGAFTYVQHQQSRAETGEAQALCKHFPKGTDSLQGGQLDIELAHTVWSTNALPQTRSIGQTWLQGK